MIANRLLALAAVVVAGLVLTQPRPGGATILLFLIVGLWCSRIYFRTNLHHKESPWQQDSDRRDVGR